MPGSSGERNGPKPKPCSLWARGCRTHRIGMTDGSRSPLERGARDGESPVAEADVIQVEFLSNARYESPGVKLGGPPSKAKDSRVTDSGRVP